MNGKYYSTNVIFCHLLVILKVKQNEQREIRSCYLLSSFLYVRWCVIFLFSRHINL